MAISSHDRAIARASGEIKKYNVLGPALICAIAALGITFVGEFYSVGMKLDKANIVLGVATVASVVAFVFSNSMQNIASEGFFKVRNRHGYPNDAILDTERARASR